MRNSGYLGAFLLSFFPQIESPFKRSSLQRKPYHCNNVAPTAWCDNLAEKLMPSLHDLVETCQITFLESDGTWAIKNLIEILRKAVSKNIRLGTPNACNFNTPMTTSNVSEMDSRNRLGCCCCCCCTSKHSRWRQLGHDEKAAHHSGCYFPNVHRFHRTCIVLRHMDLVEDSIFRNGGCHVPPRWVIRQQPIDGWRIEIELLQPVWLAGWRLLSGRCGVAIYLRLLSNERFACTSRVLSFAPFGEDFVF